MDGTRRVSVLGQVILAGMLLAGVTVPTTAEAQNSCNGLVNLQYLSGPPFGLVGDTYRIEVALGAGTIMGGTVLNVSKFRFELDCQNFAFIGCTDEGDVIRYVNDATITSSNCLDAGAVAVTWSSNGVDSPVGPNQVIFTPSAPVVIPAGTLPVAGCVVEFDVRVQTAPGLDGSPTIVQEAAGYTSIGPFDATCDNSLSSSASQSGQIFLCPACVNDQCFTQACNQQTGMCVQTNDPLSEPCEADGNLCTDDHCNGNGMCVFENNVMCQAASPPCEGGQVCNPQTGMCVNQPDAPDSTPCPDTDQNVCTTAGCNGLGICDQQHVTNPDPNCGGDHYKCYKTQQRGARFQQRNVTLVDQFGQTTTAIVRPTRFCNPVDKNGEGVSDPTAHLLCYKAKEAPSASVDVIVENQFGEQALTVGRVEQLCVPAEKDDVPSELNINHFKCYKAKPTKGSPKFQEVVVGLTDQFEMKSTRVIKPRFLCTPVDKNGEGIQNAAGHLTCYRIKDAPGQPKFGGAEITALDQFGEQDLQSFRGDCSQASFVCVPSSKRIASPSGAFLEMTGGTLDWDR